MSAPHADTRPTTLRVVSPANGALVGEVPIDSPEAVRAAVARARAVQPAWAERGVAERARILLAVRAKILANTDAIVANAAAENGKPRHEGLLHEVMTQLELLTYFCAEAERILAPQPIPLRLLKQRTSYIHYPPRGVAAIIAPWNFPNHLGFGGAAMALLAGNTVVLKPSEFTPLSAQLLRRLYIEGGVPEDCLQVVNGYGDVGATLIDAGVDFVEFTGSVATGKKVAAMCGERLIPCVLELGGKAPALVMEDADNARTLNAVLWGGYANAGQVCASIERLVVHEKVYDRFVPKLVERVKALRLGDPTTSAEVDVGPLVNLRQLEIVERLVADAVAKGATVACGGRRVEGPGLYFEPTVLTGVTPEMDILNKETFGPVLPVMKIGSEAEAILEANRSHLGLLAYVFTRDGDRGRRMAEQIRCGTVMVNDVIATAAAAETPWAGVKQSGIGVAHSDEGLRHMCEARHVNYDTVPWLSRELWWFPYQEKNLGLLRRLLALLYGSGLGRLFPKG
jgi:succinate-semialdehyde dehydrogenase/glutarate-semialdehyde dehydrogenase